MSRDRDDSGRPRNARPRDALGRPLARDVDAPADADPVALPPIEALHLADELLAAGRAFRAHEVLEAVWKSTTTDERGMWRGLAQLAVGVTHAQRGNLTGASALLRRAAQTLAPWEGTRPYDVDIDGLREWALTASADPGSMIGTPPLAPA